MTFVAVRSRTVDIWIRADRIERAWWEDQASTFTVQLDNGEKVTSNTCSHDHFLGFMESIGLPRDRATNPQNVPERPTPRAGPG